jgi:hypothetical protein
MTQSYQPRTLPAHAPWFRLLALIIVGLAPEVAEAGIKITMTYDQVNTEVSPKQQTTRSSKYRTYTISKNNRINVADSDIEQNDRSLGQDAEGHMLRGMHYKSTTRLLGNVLFVITAFDEFTSVRKIKLSGHNCVSTLVFKRNPGHEYYEEARPTETSLYSDMHAENIKCSVAETSD